MVTLDDIKQAQQRLRGVAARTPLIAYFPPAGSRPDESRIRLSRPALAEAREPAADRLLQDARRLQQDCVADRSRSAQRGVITYSSGNHAQGVAYAARALGVKAVIVMPRNAPRSRWRARPPWAPRSSRWARPAPSVCRRRKNSRASTATSIVPPYNDEQIIAGQGTVGLEILEDCPRRRPRAGAHRRRRT